MLQGVLFALLFCALNSACAHPPAPTKPQQSVKALIDDAHIAERKRDYHRAREKYKQAIDSASDEVSSAFAYREMASALIFWGEYEEAMELLLQSLKHDESQVQVWHDLGILKSRAGDPRAALSALYRAVELAPKSPRSRVALAALLVREKQFTEARQQYNIILTLKIPGKIETAVHKAIKILNVEINNSDR